MAQLAPTQDSGARERSCARNAIIALARHASIETSTRNLAEIDTYTAALPAGTDVFASWLPGAAYHHIASTAKRLRRAGFNPVPHITARQLADRVAAEDFLARLRDEAGVTRALLIAGDSTAPVGPYASSADLLATGLLPAHGIRSIGIAGYPEGHPRIADAAVMQALDRKIALAAGQALDVFVVSQFCFDAEAVLAWVRRLRARGVTLPVRVGIAGPASIRTLLSYGLRCGIGNSIRAVGSQAISLTRLVTREGPEKLVRTIADPAATLGVTGLHVFPFGGFAHGARWVNNVAAGRFQLADSAEGFDVEP